LDRQFGEHFAIKVLHPFVGLVTFNLGIVLMLVLLKPAGLRIGVPARAQSTSTTGRTSGPVSRTLAVPAVFAAIALVLVVALVVGMTNSSLRSYDLVANATGEPRLASYLAYPASPTGWNASFLTEYTWARPYFGEGSTWYRYTYTQSRPGGDLGSNLPVTADVINTNNLFSFSAYGVESCYRFHGFSLRNVALVNLGGGITGQTLAYSTRDSDWSILYWVWPIKSGGSTRYERVILYMLNTADGKITAPGVTGLSNLRGNLNPHDQVQRRLIDVRNFLVGFGKEVVKGQASVAQGSRLPRPVPPIRRRRLIGHSAPPVTTAPSPHPAVSK
jgi:hypothetical protein